MKIQFKKVQGMLIPYSNEDKASLDKLKDDVGYVVDIKNSEMRTIKQNSSIHLWCKLIATSLNNNNLSITSVIKIDVEWSTETVKEIIFKPVVKALYNKDSTTKLNKDEFDKIIDNIVIIFGKKGIEIPPFPGIGF